MSTRKSMMAVLACLSTMSLCALQAVAAQKPISASIHPYNCGAEVNPEILQLGERERREGMAGKRYIKNIAVSGEGGVAVKFKEPLQLKELRFIVYIPKLSQLRAVVNGTDRLTKQRVSVPIKIEAPALIERTSSGFRIDIQKGTQKDPAQFDISEVRLVEKNDPDRRGKASEYLRIDFNKVGDAGDIWSEPNELSFEVVKCD